MVSVLNAIAQMSEQRYALLTLRLGGHIGPRLGQTFPGLANILSMARPSDPVQSLRRARKMSRCGMRARDCAI